MTPSYIEDHISQIPALQLLIKMGYQYVSPEEAMELRGGRTSNVLLEPILKKQLEKINSIQYKNKEFSFSETNINTAIIAMRELPIQDGFIKANQEFYDLITLGKSLEQTILNDKKSFSFQFIDWKNIENNIFHVTEEYAVLRSERNDTYRPDIVLFINGIPMVIIECKSNVIKDPVNEAISQHLRNQQEDGIRGLYQYSNIVFSLAVNEARYATTATQKEFWSVWKEVFRSKDEGIHYGDAIRQLKNSELPNTERTAIFNQRFKNVLQFFNQLEKEEVIVTEQDKLIFSLCQKQRILDLIFNYIVYDDGVKKITRYQQYFAIKETLKKISIPDANGKRIGGVIWHTQGSGKSLTMVMLAQMIATQKDIKNPKIILVTDRIDLNTQITETFQKCHVGVEEAQTGKHLVELINSPTDAVITTLIHKFEAAINQTKEGFTSPNIFVLIDEGHRSQYGTFNVKMQKVFPKACFVAFTGTPLMKKEKSTANKFGGLIDVYSINDAVEDKAVVPLLYEGRHNIIEVNDKPLDTYFDRVSEQATLYGKVALKRKFSSTNQINKADQVVEARAWDISDHFVDNIQGTGFKAQLVAPNKTTAIKYREYLKEIGKVSCEVLISAPDTRENYDDAFEENEDVVLKFHKAMMSKYGKQETYEKSVISAFKKQEKPEIIIVVDKLLTGFDAPNNQVLYVTRALREHTLLQAIARVNRVAPGKEYGFIIDYFGNLENLDSALNTYSGLDDFEQEELAGTIININKEIEKLPQAHSELWDLFKTIKNKYDAEAYSELLSDDSIRHPFYDKLSAFIRLFKLAMASIEFNDIENEKTIDRYKKDSKFFLQLRVDVKRRYYDDIDISAFEPQIQKLIDKHITTGGEVLKITELVNIFDKDKREAEVEKMVGKAAKADHIATRTIKALNIKMNEDPIFYKSLSTLIREAISDYHQHRIDEALYLQRAKEYENQFLTGKQNNVPSSIQQKPNAIAFFNLINAVFENSFNNTPEPKEVQAKTALEIEECIKSSIYENNTLIIDWQTNSEIEKELKNNLDDLLFEKQQQYDMQFSFDKIDELIEEVIKIAKLKYI
ncbi:type I restriction enzyme R subunit [Mariniflexile fucanivorans]|uniref:Type I restriction enzyme endonuclease subunit n=1 Tax=Mariniflexile fucanivorans TaxID=264023 RepID=A0A4R1RDU8_9FLAO|nr:HsdR family type I site-specific deoxyribonuclease [Mariniflexile fucanivorans]TCL64058.1 type I restriction enzyme R subunit [Mariniflexile fucanivorans]